MKICNLRISLAPSILVFLIASGLTSWNELEQEAHATELSESKTAEEVSGTIKFSAYVRGSGGAPDRYRYNCENSKVLYLKCSKIEVEIVFDVGDGGTRTVFLSLKNHKNARVIGGQVMYVDIENKVTTVFSNPNKRGRRDKQYEGITIKLENICSKNSRFLKNQKKSECEGDAKIF